MAVPSLALPIGTKAVDFVLPGTDGKTYSLSDFAAARALVVVFSCNHCPYAKAAWPLLVKLADEYKDKGIAFVAINPNDEKQYPEDSFEVMKAKVSEWGINFPYLRDQSQEIARAFQAQCTPDIYVFDFKRELYYHGRINDNWQEPEKVKKEELREALDRLLDGKKSSEVQNPSIGCSIKWIG